MSARRRVAPDGDALDLFAPPAVVASPPARAARRAVAAPADRQAAARAWDDDAIARLGPVDPYAHEVEAPEELPGASPASAVSVSTLTRTCKDLLEGAFVPLWVRGEVTDFKRHRNGHWYFALRDGESQIRCVVWNRDQRRMPTNPDEGMQVSALAQVTMYAARGDVQLSVKAIEVAGDGLWRKALEEAMARLAADGLLDPARKRAIPRMPRRVVVITSPDGAALHDIVAVARRRSPQVAIVVVAARVQGDGAPEELIAALERVGAWVRAAARAGEPCPVDTVIIGRGGGAREDLWAFNDERLVRALARCPVPTISAVGHEVDVSLCDLVADHRAATPSVAAETAVPVRAELVAALHTLGGALVDAATARATHARGALQRTAGALTDRAARLAERRRARIAGAAGRLQALSPLATLARGYAVARDADGRALTGIAAFAPGDAFALVVRDGEVRARVEDVRPGAGAAADGPAAGRLGAA